MMLRAVQLADGRHSATNTAQPICTSSIVALDRRGEQRAADDAGHRHQRDRDEDQRRRRARARRSGRSSDASHAARRVSLRRRLDRLAGAAAWPPRAPALLRRLVLLDQVARASAAAACRRGPRLSTSADPLVVEVRAWPSASWRARTRESCRTCCRGRPRACAPAARASHCLPNAARRRGAAVVVDDLLQVRRQAVVLRLVHREDEHRGVQRRATSGRSRCGTSTSSCALIDGITSHGSR